MRQGKTGLLVFTDEFGGGVKAPLLTGCVRISRLSEKSTMMESNRTDQLSFNRKFTMWKNQHFIIAASWKSISYILKSAYIFALFFSKLAYFFLFCACSPPLLLAFSPWGWSSCCSPAFRVLLIESAGKKTQETNIAFCFSALRSTKM